MLNKKFNSIIFLLALSFSGGVMAQVIDSTLPRPNGGPTLGKLFDSSSSDLSSGKPVPSTITEYVREVCPTGLTGPDGTNTVIVSQRHVTTFKLNGNIVGVSETEWEDVDQDCVGREIRDLGCPTNQRGENKQERRKVTNDNGSFEYSPWSSFINTCAFYKKGEGSELRPKACPAGQVGSITEKRVFEIWSDGSNRNYGSWFVIEDTCKLLPSGPLNQILTSVRGGGYPSRLPGSPAPIGLRMSVNNGTAYGLTLDRRTKQLQCLVARNWSDGSYESNILPLGASVDYTGNDSMPNPSYCIISGGGFTGKVGGSCDYTAGGDSDHCIAGTASVTVTNPTDCQATLKIIKNGRIVREETINVCN